jgi:magnesium transporter
MMFFNKNKDGAGLSGKQAPGASPGTLSYVGKIRQERVKIEVIDYDKDNFQKHSLKNALEAAPYANSQSVTWINVTGVHEAKKVAELGKVFSLHPLTLEDIMDTTQRPKVDEYEEYLFIVLKMAYYSESGDDIIIEQVSLVLGKNYVISFQENKADILDPLRERIRQGQGKIRKEGSAYLMYAIIDLITDHYFTILEELGEKIEYLEEDVLRRADFMALKRIYNIKQALIILSKAIWPMRDVVNRLEKTEHKLFKGRISLYLRDVYDHSIQVVETLETYRDMVSGIHDLYLSNQSNRMNEVMKVLTIFASIFIPLTFIAGVYGMNFDHMPELRTENGYYVLWGIFIALATGMLVYFRRKKWL